MTRIRKVLICLMFQGRDYFIHGLEKLREEFFCAVSCRLVSISLKWMFAAQRRHFDRENEIRESDGNENGQKEYGSRSFIRASMTDSGQYGMGSRRNASLFRVKWVLRHFFLLWPWVHIGLTIRLSNEEMDHSQMLRRCISSFARLSNIWSNIADGIIYSGMSSLSCGESSNSKKVSRMFISSSW
jgi:hypothetical protein